MVSNGNGVRRLVAAGAALIAALVVPAVGWADAGVPARCAVPDAYLKFSTALDRTEGLLDRKRPVRVLVLGPALSAEGQDRRSLEMALEQKLAGSQFEITEIMSAGRAEDDFERLRGVVAETSPDLVIWQVGVHDAMASSDVSDFEAVLDQASAWMNARGPDLVLVDPPFVPHVAHERIYTPYVGEIGEVSRTEGVPVIRRYAAMQYLSMQDQAKRLPVVSGALPRSPCVTELMAEAIVRAVR
jgi:acyl-CoA thioesterase I